MRTQQNGMLTARDDSHHNRKEKLVPAHVTQYCVPLPHINYES